MMDRWKNYFAACIVTIQAAFKCGAVVRDGERMFVLHIFFSYGASCAEHNAAKNVWSFRVIDMITARCSAPYMVGNSILLYTHSSDATVVWGKQLKGAIKDFPHHARSRALMRRAHLTGKHLVLTCTYVALLKLCWIHLLYTHILKKFILLVNKHWSA